MSAERYEGVGGTATRLHPDDHAAPMPLPKWESVVQYAEVADVWELQGPKHTDDAALMLATKAPANGVWHLSVVCVKPELASALRLASLPVQWSTFVVALYELPDLKRVQVRTLCRLIARASATSNAKITADLIGVLGLAVASGAMSPTASDAANGAHHPHID